MTEPTAASTERDSSTCLQAYGHRGACAPVCDVVRALRKFIIEEWDRPGICWYCHASWGAKHQSACLQLRTERVLAHWPIRPGDPAPASADDIMGGVVGTAVVDSDAASDSVEANLGHTDHVPVDICGVMLDMMRAVGPEREESDPKWKALCERAREYAGVHPGGA